MKSIKIVKAGEVAGNAPPDVSIELSGAPPEFEKLKAISTADFYEGANNWYEAQATRLGSTLIETLPGGTPDRLICFLLRQKASYFRVPYVKPTELLFNDNLKS